jgi:acetyltransferase-like isoleucine patch superfamily enzyme
MEDTFSNDQLLELAELLAPILTPLISQRLLKIPTFWGKPSRVSYSKSVNLVNTFFNLSSGRVIIGDDTFFGNHVSILTGTHDITQKDQDRKIVSEDVGDVIIGKGVWIASHVVIIGPCTIGDYAVIGAGSVVLPGIYEEGCLYAGSPATYKKHIKFADLKNESDLL